MTARLRRLLRRVIPEPAAPGPKVLGVGWAKTGTTTLGECLRALGLRHAGQRLALVEPWARGDLAPLLRVARTHQAFEDWPWLLLFREFDRAFPGTRFILTTREPAGWLHSYRNQIARPDALLVVDWSRGDGWPELCRFLGRPVPATPFPHANRGVYRDPTTHPHVPGCGPPVGSAVRTGPATVRTVDPTGVGEPIPAILSPHANRGVDRHPEVS